MVETRRLSQLVDSVVRRLALPPGDLVVALSGGADSAALAYLCEQSGRPLRGLHVDHGLAGSPLMEKAARTIAETLEVDLQIVPVDVEHGASPEGQARRARYEAFDGAVSPGETLLTGHTRDDDAETVLLNMIRGTGARGLTGIPYWRPPCICRPMLSVTRAETREIAALAGLGFIEDPMNEDPGLTRNVLRRKIIPTLRQLNPKLDESLARIAKALSVDIEHLEGVTPFEAIWFDDGTAAVPIGLLRTSAPAISDRLIMRMIALVVGGSGVTADRVDRVRSVVDDEAPRQEIARGARATRSGPMLILEKSPETSSSDVSVALAPGTHRVGPLEFEVSDMSGPCRVLPLSRWAAVFPPGTELVAQPDGVITANGEPAWEPGRNRFPVAWYEPGSIGYLSVFAREKTRWK